MKIFEIMSYSYICLPIMITVIVKVVLPVGFSNVTENSPEKFLWQSFILRHVRFLMVSVSILFLSGRSPPLNVHVTVGCGLDLNGSSKTLALPFGMMTTSLKSSSLHSGATVIIKFTFVEIS